MQALGCWKQVVVSFYCSKIWFSSDVQCPCNYWCLFLFSCWHLFWMEWCFSFKYLFTVTFSAKYNVIVIHLYITLAWLSSHFRVETRKFSVPLCLPHTWNKRCCLEVVSFKHENLLAFSWISMITFPMKRYFIVEIISITSFNNWIAN